MAQFTLDHIITEDQFLDLVDTAGYAIGYWADRAEVHWGAADKKYSVWEDDDDNTRHDITPDMIEQAMVDIYTGKIPVSKGILDSVTSAIMEEEYGEVDGDAADVIIQIAAFGEIVYG